MPMSPKLLRPRQTIHPEAAAWASRVRANGSYVSGTTLVAVSKFCRAIDSAGIRSRFYRLNLFCGGAGSSDTTRLNAALVPLYRGPSVSNTFGSATDTNAGAVFATSDYNETGSVSGGLAGNGSKYLNTGFATNTLSDGNRHLAAYEITRSGSAFQKYLGSEYSTGVAGNFSLGYHGSGTARTFGFGAFGPSINSPSSSAGGFWIGVNQSAGNGIIYGNGSQDSTGATTGATPQASNIFVFGLNRASTPATPLADGYSGRLGGYSIGLSMTAQQVADYNTAMQAFQTALQRNV